MNAHEISNTKEWKDISLQIRKENGMCCERCGQKTESPGKTLTVHHWDGDGKNNNRNNLVALCQSCHLPKVQAKFIKAKGMHEFWELLNKLDQEDADKGITIQKTWYSKLKQIKEFNPKK
jgi:5-methylcytosine-specific restriction endonuclease McrA